MSGFCIAPASFKATAKRGTNVHFALSESAGVSIAIERVQPGRRVGKLCKGSTPRLSSHPPCKRTTHAGVLNFPNRSAGANTIRFSGRIGGRTEAR